MRWSLFPYSRGRLYARFAPHASPIVMAERPPPSDAAPSTREVHSIGKYTIDPIGRWGQGLGQGSPLRKASSFRSISIIFTTFIHGADKFKIEILVVCRVS